MAAYSGLRSGKTAMSLSLQHQGFVFRQVAAEAERLPRLQRRGLPFAGAFGETRRRSMLKHRRRTESRLLILQLTSVQYIVSRHAPPGQEPSR